MLTLDQVLDIGLEVEHDVEIAAGAGVEMQGHRKWFIRLDSAGADIEIDDFKAAAGLLVQPQQSDVLQVQSTEGDGDIEIGAALRFIGLVGRLFCFLRLDR